MPNKLKLMLLISSCLWVNACALAPIVGTPPDIPICTNLGDHGYCRYTLSAKPYIVKSSAWENTLSKSLIIPAQSWAELKAWQLNVCHQIQCDNGVGSWSKFVNDLDTHLK